MQQAIARYFDFASHRTNFKTELSAGLTTFLTMSYIIFVNPSILADAGMDQGAVFVATCLAAAVGCLIMGLYAKLPVALAPGMGLNAFFTYGVVLGMGYTWQTALGAVFLSGILFLIISLFKVREWVINAIPDTLKLSIVAGLGAFLGFIALKNAGIVVAYDATFVTLGDLGEFNAMMAILGFLIIVALSHFKVMGSVVIGILVVSVLALLFGQTSYTGLVSLPPSMAPTFMQLDIAGAFNIGMLSVIFAFLFVDLFDTSGTLIGVSKKAGLMTANGQVPRIERALLADSSATVAGTVFGTSSTTSYVESASGVAAGGRTGLVAVVVAVLFLVSMLFAPLAGMIPAYATAGAIFYVAVLMLFSLSDIEWSDLTEAAPAAVVLLMMPLTFSIADGIALGFITYTVVKAITGKFDQISPAVWIISLLLLLKFAFL